MFVVMQKAPTDPVFTMKEILKACQEGGGELFVPQNEKERKQYQIMSGTTDLYIFR